MTQGQQQFRMTGKHTKFFGGMAVLGIILLALGYVLSTLELGGGHGKDHGGEHHNEQKHEDGHGGGTDHHASAAGTVMHFTGHGEGHGPSGGESDATEDVMCYNASKGSGNGKDTAEVD